MQFFRHFPLPQLGHTNAIPSAYASYCAGQQKPEYFWDMHDWLFANQKTWASAKDAPDQFRKQALSLGVNAAKFDECLKAPTTKAAIDRDLKDGRSMGVTGSPSFFANDWSIVGAQPYAEFQKAIDKALQGIHPPSTPTPAPRPTPTPTK